MDAFDRSLSAAPRQPTSAGTKALHASTASSSIAIEACLFIVYSSVRIIGAGSSCGRDAAQEPCDRGNTERQNQLSFFVSSNSFFFRTGSRGLRGLNHPVSTCFLSWSSRHRSQPSRLAAVGRSTTARDASPLPRWLQGAWIYLHGLVCDAKVKYVRGTALFGGRAIIVPLTSSLIQFSCPDERAVMNIHTYVYFILKYNEEQRNICHSRLFDVLLHSTCYTRF